MSVVNPSYVAPDYKGVTRGQEGHNDTGDAESLAGAEKTQKFRKSFLHFSIFAFESRKVRTRGRQTCSLPRAPSNLGTLLSGY